MTEGLTTWQQVALIAGPAIAAIAALASWASVWQARKLGREATAPHLQVQKVVQSYNGTIGAVITNAGGGAARGVGIYLTYPPYFVAGPIGHGFLYPGETRVVWTQIPNTDPPEETDVMVLCRDRDGFPHYWTADERHKVFKNWHRGPKYNKDPYGIFRDFHPAVDLNTLTQVEMSVTAE